MIINTTSGKKIEALTQSSILDSAYSAGLIFEHSCKNGRCGSCKATLLDGKVEEIQTQLSLTEAERASHKILTCCCAPVTDILIDAEDLSMLKDVKVKVLPARIARIEKLSDNIIEVVLRFPATAGFMFLEGQYIDVIWDGFRRSYSISSVSTEKEVTLLIKKVEKGVMSNYWFNQAKVNDLLRVEGPKGTFFMRDTSASLVFIATGTGIAPIRAILEKLERDLDFEQQSDIYLFWGNRYKEDFVWQPNFKKLNVEIEFAISKADKSWTGKMDYVQNVVLDKLGGAIKNMDVYACGGNAMIESAKQSFILAGQCENQFYSDAFVQSY